MVISVARISVQCPTEFFPLLLRLFLFKKDENIDDIQTSPLRLTYMIEINKPLFDMIPLQLLLTFSVHRAVIPTLLLKKKHYCVELLVPTTCCSSSSNVCVMSLN